MVILNYSVVCIKFWINKIIFQSKLKHTSITLWKLKYPWHHSRGIITCDNHLDYFFVKMKNIRGIFFYNNLTPPLMSALYKWNGPRVKSASTIHIVNTRPTFNFSVTKCLLLQRWLHFCILRMFMYHIRHGWSTFLFSFFLKS